MKQPGLELPFSAVANCLLLEWQAKQKHPTVTLYFFIEKSMAFGTFEIDFISVWLLEDVMFVKQFQS